MAIMPDGKRERFSSPSSVGQASATTLGASRSSIDTTNTVYSPQGVRGHGVGAINQRDDVFTSTCSSGRAKGTVNNLSPSAQVFEPSNGVPLRKQLFSGSIPDQHVDTTDDSIESIATHSTGPVTTLVSTRRPGPAETAFTTDFYHPPTRYVSIHGSNRNSMSVADIKSATMNLTGRCKIVQSHPRSTNFKAGHHMYLAFDSLSRAMDFMNDHSLDCIGAREFVDLSTYLELVGTDDGRTQVNVYEGQLVLKVVAESQLASPTTDECYAAALSWMDSLMGRKELRALSLLGPVTNMSTSGFAFRIEIDSLTIADFLLNTSNTGERIESTDFTATVELFQPPGYRPILRRQLEVVPRSPRREDSSNYTIDINRILAGLDVRTTVMLRNIPNQMTTYDLESILRTWVPGAYDFLYLRIDFTNMANVGYAFVNFATPLDIVILYQHLRANGWPQTRSRKIAALSYATIQGTEALVEKFRNSSVMCEAPMCRPRLFISQADAHAVAEDTDDNSFLGTVGAELPFPAPNNEAKLNRSRQNAETQGLWPANSRDEHRRNNGGYLLDRGNPHAPGLITLPGGMIPGQPFQQQLARRQARGNTFNSQNPVQRRAPMALPYRGRNTTTGTFFQTNA